jgi:hypothetical protein
MPHSIDRPVCLDYLNVLRTDQPANWGSYKDEKDWTRAMEDPGFATRFTAAMDCRGIYLGPAMARAVNATGLTHLLDIAVARVSTPVPWWLPILNFGPRCWKRRQWNRVARQMIEQRGFNERVSVH